MNKILKIIVISLNIIILLVALYWLNNNNEPEPLIVVIGQITVIISLVFENKASKIFTKNIDNSKVKIERKNTDKIHTENIKDSNIHIK